MAEQLIVFKPGDRFATLDKDGSAVVWKVNNNGLPYDALNETPKEAMVKEPRRRADDDG